jgi:hypothetical protein
MITKLTVSSGEIATLDHEPADYKARCGSTIQGHY